MPYSINVESAGNKLWKGTATIGDMVVGPVRIACATEQEAHDYMEQTFLPDLRTNYPEQFSELVFPWEVVEPPVEEVV